MSKRNRAARRQRSDSSTTPKRWWRPGWRFASILAAVLFIGGLGAYQNMLRRTDIASATATPTPNGTSGSSIALTDGEALGAAIFPARDSVTGGQGQTVNGIECAAQEYAAFHIHAHLALFVAGRQVQVPAQVGFPPAGKPCLYWLHTHDASGIIHVESPIYRAFTLGDFFDIWGEPVNDRRLGTLTGAIRAFVNGSRYDGDVRAIPLGGHQQITVEIATPYVPPPNYRFPPGDT